MSDHTKLRALRLGFLLNQDSSLLEAKIVKTKGSLEWFNSSVAR